MHEQMKSRLNAWEDMLEENIKMDLAEIGWENVDWNHVALNRGQQQACVKIVINFLVP